MDDHTKSRKQLIHELLQLRQNVQECRILETTLRNAEVALRDSERRFRAVAQSAVDGIVSVDKNGQIAFVNSAVQKMFGYSEEELVGAEVSILIPPSLREAHRKAMERYLATGQPKIIGHTVELQAVRKGGDEFPIELSLASWTSQEQIFFTGIIRDITERRVSALALETRSTESERRREELESLVQMVAHDLKSPVVTVGGWVRKLRATGLQALDQARYDRILEQIEVSSGTMEGFLRDLLDALALEGTEADRVPVDMSEVIHEALRDQEQAVQDKRINVVLDLHPTSLVLGDRHRLKQVVDNLITNALKYMGTSSNGVISVSLSDKADFVVTKVADNGVGIDPQFQSRVFDRFFRVPNPGAPRGSALGLFIVKKIVESLGGQVWLESEPGKGSAFSFSIPRGEGFETD